MKKIIILLIAFMFNCGDSIIYKSSGEDTLYIDTENPIITKSGNFILSKDSTFDFLQDSILSTFDIKMYSTNKYKYFLYCFKDGYGGVQIADGVQAPFTGYKTIETIYAAGLLYTLPLHFFVLCRDNLHFCSVVMDSFFINSDSTDCSAYFHYTLNLEPNDTRF